MSRHRTAKAKMFVKADRDRKAQYIRDCKSRPCTDCGVEYDWWVMQFDHVDPSTKEHEASKLSRRSWDTISIELNKCEVVCANCHLDRTYRLKHYLTARGESKEHDPCPQRDMFPVSFIR